MFSEHAILLRLGDLYMDKQNYSSAKLVLLKACSQFSSAAAWFGTGTLFLLFYGSKLQFSQIDTT
jgi:uncharacterized protein HemY